MPGRSAELDLFAKRRSPASRYICPLLALVAFVPTVLRAGWPEPVIPHAVGLGIQVAALLAIVATILIPALVPPRVGLRGRRIEFALALGALVLGPFSWPLAAALTSLLVLYHVLTLYLDLVQTSIPPGLVFVGSFILFSALGTAALMLPAAVPESAPPINLLDAAFTIVSAISQTGLVVRDTGSEFTRFGQIVILIWIQVGALGVIVFGALLASVFGSSFGLRAQRTIAEDTEQGWSGQLSLTKLVVFTVVVTHLIELVGVVVLYFGWPETWEGAPDISEPGDRLFHSVFFTVSAFCNAGFATTGNSMQGLRSHWTPHLVLVPLIILGSIGFPVLDNIRQTFLARVRGIRVIDGRLVRFNLNTKVILSATLIIYVIGYVGIFIGETTQANVPVGAAALDAHFMNINRTSGFDSIAPNDMGILSRLVLILLMFIGGSPGSVAGGIKMMVFAVLALTVWSTLMGRRQTEVFGRTIPDVVVRKSATLITLSLATVMISTGVLAATETRPGLTLGMILFDSVSAFGTTGLSMGVAGEATVPGKITFIVTMFMGRVGPLAVLAGLLSLARGSKPRYEYPTEDVVIY